MSLTVFVHYQEPTVIVKWFLESKGLVIFASGPLIRINSQEFRESGWKLVQEHFQTDYRTTRLQQGNIRKPFQPGEAKKVMKGSRVLEIHLRPDNDLIISPMVVEKYSLADLARVKPVAELRVPLNSSSKIFWEVFDKAIADAPMTE